MASIQSRRRARVRFGAVGHEDRPVTASQEPVRAQPRPDQPTILNASYPQTPTARENPSSPGLSPDQNPSLHTKPSPPEPVGTRAMNASLEHSGDPAAPRPLPSLPVSPAGQQTPTGRFAGKAWLLLAIPLGFTTWAAFLYIGVRARRPVWLAWAAVYAATRAGYAALDTPVHPSSTAKGVAAALALVTWIGGGIHAILVSNDARRRIQDRTDPGSGRRPCPHPAPSRGKTPGGHPAGTCPRSRRRTPRPRRSQRLRPSRRQPRPSRRHSHAARDDRRVGQTHGRRPDPGRWLLLGRRPRNDAQPATRLG